MHEEGDWPQSQLSNQMRHKHSPFLTVRMEVEDLQERTRDTPVMLVILPLLLMEDSPQIREESSAYGREETS